MKIPGLLLCFAGMMLLCGMDATAKALGAYFNTFQIGFLRFGGAALFMMLYIAARRSDWPRLRNWRGHLLRGMLGVSTAILFFYGVTHLPLAIATALAMSAPIYVSLFGMIFFKERPSRTLWIAIALAFAGSAVIVLGGPLADGSGGDPLGWVAGLLAPITYAGAIALLKHQSESETAEALTLGTATVAALILMPAAIPGFVLPDMHVWPLMGLAGFLGATGFVLLTNGLRTTAASTFAIVDYASLLWAAFLGYLFFTEVPETRFWIGGAMIVAACIVVLRTASKDARASEEQTPVTG